MENETPLADSMAENGFTGLRMIAQGVSTALDLYWAACEENDSPGAVNEEQSQRYVQLATMLSQTTRMGVRFSDDIRPLAKQAGLNVDAALSLLREVASSALVLSDVESSDASLALTALELEVFSCEDDIAAWLDVVENMPDELV